VAIALPLTAKEALRRNEEDYRVPETVADKWNQIVHLDDRLDEVTDDPSTKMKLEAARTRVLIDLSQSQRIKSLLGMPEYKGVINRILRMPGLHAEFINKNFEVFSKGRTIEVTSLPKPGELSFIDCLESWARPASILPPYPTFG
jgi:hypothetical protein